jgi:hypothetical protein
MIGMLTGTTLGGLRDDARTAVMDSLVAALVCDGNAGVAETQRFEHEVRKIPWGLPDHAIIEMVKVSRDRPRARAR